MRKVECDKYLILIVEMHLYPPSAMNAFEWENGKCHEITPLLAYNPHLCFFLVRKCYREGKYLCPPFQTMADQAELSAFPGLTPTDRENLAGGDENFKPHNWEDLKRIIGSIHFIYFD